MKHAAILQFIQGWPWLFMGPVFGAMFGIILGLFAFVASKIMKK